MTVVSARVPPVIRDRKVLQFMVPIGQEYLALLVWVGDGATVIVVTGVIVVSEASPMVLPGVGGVADPGAQLREVMLSMVAGVAADLPWVVFSEEPRDGMRAGFGVTDETWTWEQVRSTSFLEVYGALGVDVRVPALSGIVRRWPRVLRGQLERHMVSVGAEVVRWLLVHAYDHVPGGVAPPWVRFIAGVDKSAWAHICATDVNVLIARPVRCDRSGVPADIDVWGTAVDAWVGDAVSVGWVLVSPEQGEVLL